VPDAVKAKNGTRRRSSRAEGQTARLSADVELAVDAETVELRESKLVDEPEGSLKALLRDELAALDADRRNEISAELAASPLAAENSSLELSGSLYEIREVLRERLPACAVDARQPAGLAVEQILAIDERSFWISGWMHDEDGEGAVTLVSPEGVRTEVTEDAFRFERPDVVQFYAPLRGTTRNHGFTAFFELPAPSLLTDGWIAELQTSDGVAVEIRCPAVVVDPLAIRATILGELGNRGPVGGELAAEHGRYALTRLQERIVADSGVESVDVYGELPSEPIVSIVIPLYKRLDFIEHQFLQFSTDPDFAEAELVYVLDSVEQKDELAGKARELFALYGLPFKVVNLTAGAGFAGANRHGIEASKAPQLLLLNSDVIPDRPGWLTAMREFYATQEGIGALGPKLLYEDDSLQHAGLYFHRGAELWENAHFFKGLHRAFPAANVARPVPAVTAACMLIDRERYEEAGGLPLHYVQGDYEDSELCLRLSKAGYENWYLPQVELYHLEGQSYVADTRRVPSEYNMWLHSEIWGDRIEELMAQFDPHS
jgi:GT2 family glycosyltransferase